MTASVYCLRYWILQSKGINKAREWREHLFILTIDMELRANVWCFPSIFWKHITPLDFPISKPHNLVLLPMLKVIFHLTGNICSVKTILCSPKHFPIRTFSWPLCLGQLDLSERLVFRPVIVHLVRVHWSHWLKRTKWLL